jgi:hypothetical protein
MAGNGWKPRPRTRYRSSSSLSSDSNHPPSPPPSKRVNRPDRYNANEEGPIDAPPSRKAGAKTPRAVFKRIESETVPKQQLIDALHALEPGVLGRLLGLQVKGGAEDGRDVEEGEDGEDERQEEEVFEEDGGQEETGEDYKAQGERDGAGQGQKGGAREDEGHVTDPDDEEERDLEHKA